MHHQVRVSTLEIAEFMMHQFLSLLLLAWHQLYMFWFIIVKRLKPPNTDSRSPSPVSTDSGKDANAAGVTFLRYIYTFRPHDIRLDSHLRYYDWLSLSREERFLAHIITSSSLLLKTVTEIENGFVAARTALIDRLVIEAIKPFSVDGSPKTQQHDALRIDSEASRVQSCASDVFSDGIMHCRYFKQIIILGAGYDSRGFRFQELCRNRVDGFDVRIIEVDQSSVQRRKISRLISQLGEGVFNRLSQGIEYIECNFDYPEALSSALKSSSHFQPSLPTLVLMEGVSYYLTKQAVEETLMTLYSLRDKSGQLQLPEWKLIFDFTDAGIFLPTAPLAQRFFLEYIAAYNAPFQFGLPLEQNKLNAYLRPFGIEVRNVWDYIAITREAFTVERTSYPSIPLALAECDWI